MAMAMAMAMGSAGSVGSARDGERGRDRVPAGLRDGHTRRIRSVGLADGTDG